MLILWGWAALIAFSSMFLLFFRFVDVLIGFVVLAVLLTIATLYPYFKRMGPGAHSNDGVLPKSNAPKHVQESGRHNRQLRSSCKSPAISLPHLSSLPPRSLASPA